MSSQGVNYNESSKTVQAGYGFELLDKLPVSIQPGWKVADLGCGTGYLATKVADIVGEQGLVLALDPNSKRVDYLKQQPEVANCKNLVILNQGAESCNFNEYGKFNLMFSNIVMHWIPEDQLKTVYESTFKALDNGGYLAVAVAEMTQEEDGNRSMFHNALPDDVKTELFKHVYCRPLKWYVDLAQGAGFTIVDQGYLYVHTSYENMEDYFVKLNATFEDMFQFEKYFDRKTLEKFGLKLHADGHVSAEKRISFFIARKD